MLESYGYQVTCVTNGDEAFSLLSEHTYHLILLDINMPEMSGIETMMKMREREELKDIPVVFLTADGESETEVVCLKLGASDFIMKPFVKPIMLCRIERILELAELKKKLETLCKKDLKSCSYEELYSALLKITEEESAKKIKETEGRKLYYISAEFLIGFGCEEFSEITKTKKSDEALLQELNTLL